MFSVDNTSHTHSTRSKRTRQVAGNDDSVKLPLTKKRRSALRRDTFEPLTDASINEISGREAKAENANGHAVEPSRTQTQNTSQPRELTLRGVKKTEKRADRGGGQLMLSSNDFYTVAQLPSLPDQIRSHPSMPYSCVISPENDYVLALTHTDALIWPYNSSASVPSARDLISFRLPFPPATATDPLPLAAFTAKSANGEPGIVAVSPKWGKVVYWESVTNASSFVAGQSTSGIQGSIPGLLKGEAIEELVKAEPAGFIITFSHGRVAHLTVRDQMGRPGIGVQFLRKSAAGSAKGGIFGSIRNVFGGDRRKGTPVVRAGKSSKAQRDVIIGTEDAEFEFWSTNLSVGNSMTKTLSIKDELTSALESQVPGVQAAQLKIIDFEVASTPTSGHDIAKRGDIDSSPLVLLVAVTTNENATYFMLEAVVLEDGVHVREVNVVKYNATDDTSVWRPKLCISRGQPAAFILFEKAVVLMSLARIRESPSSQLLREKVGLPERFQDSIRFQDDSIYKVLGFAGEETDALSACVFAVQGFGIVRITSKLQNDDEVDVEELENSIGPKSKIEQAIFFGTIRQNPLELSKPTTDNFAPEEIETAVTEISNEVLSSTSKYLPKSAPSTENHMKLRAKALEDLADHALKYYSTAITRKTRFQLLWNAEKLAAAQSLWKVQERIQQTYPRKDDREMTYLNFVLRALHESRQEYPDPEKGEKDHVRHWLVNSVPKIDHLMSEITSCLVELDDMDVKDPRIVCDYLIEAVDLWIATYHTAFKFREDHASIYGLGDEVLEEGILQTAYPPGLPAPWTSSPEPFRFGERLVYDICNFLKEWWDFNSAANGRTKGKKGKEIPTSLEGKPYDAPSKEAMLDLASRLPAEVELFSRMTREATTQAQANIKSEVENQNEQKRQISELKDKVRTRLVQAISTISRYNAPGAIELAEKIKDPGLLVTLNTEYLKELEEEAHLHPEERPLLEQKIIEIQEHVETYFEKFGNPWAFAHFSNMIQYGSLGSILAEAQANKGQKQKYLSWFLKKSDKIGQRVGKISWINEVVGEHKFDRAQKTLEQVAQDEETDVWAKKTELCLAKLIGLAANEATESPQNVLADAVAKYDEPLALLELQEALIMHIKTSVSDAIDEKAARDLAVDIFATRVVDKTTAFKRLLLATLDSILANQSLTLVSLINMLTLMDPAEFAGPPENDPNVQGHEFSVALQAIDLSSTAKISSDSILSSTDLDTLRMLVWRRSMIRDNWAILNETSGKSDHKVMQEMQMSALFKTLLEVFQNHYESQSSSSDSSTSSMPKLFSPQEILDTKINLSETLKQCYLTSVGTDGTSVEGKRFQDALNKEMEAEQTKLKKYVEKAQLEKYWEGMVREAERNVRAYVGLDDIDGDGDGGAVEGDGDESRLLENGNGVVESVEGGASG